jgi:CO/xanthine dehydrogenase FAD-binding subunit
MYLRPRTVDEVLQALATHGGRILAGGTDFFPALGDKPVTGPVIDISGLGGLSDITVSSEEVRIGACTTWKTVVEASLPRAFNALKAAAREVGAIQIQNMGTVGGNLCTASPAADGVPPLLALDAEVELRSLQGHRRMPLRDFIASYRKTLIRADEILTAVVVPRTINGPSAFLKLGVRRYLVISIAMVAAILEIHPGGTVKQARIAVGACSAVAQRLRALERDLTGAVAGPGLGAVVRPDHLEILSPIDDLRGTANYRRDATLTLIRRALDACLADACLDDACLAEA